MNETIVGYIVSYKRNGRQEFSKVYVTKGGATGEYNRVLKWINTVEVHHLPVYVKIPI